MEETTELGYERNLNHTYLVYHGMVQENDYEIQMLLNNKIPGLLSCHLEKKDGKAILYYEITSRQPLSRIYEKKKMNYDSMKALFQNMQMVFEKMEEYLLSTAHLRMDAQMIYMNPEENQCGFCLIPNKSGENNELHSLMEFLLECIDYSDEKAVAAAYECYKKSGEDNYSFNQIFREVFQDVHVEKWIMEDGKRESPPLPDFEEMEKDISPPKKELENRKPVKLIWKIIIAAIVFAFVAIVFILLDIYRSLMEKALAGVALAAVLTGYFAYRQGENEEALDFIFDENIEEEINGVETTEEQQKDQWKKPEFEENPKYGETVFFHNEQIKENRTLEPVRNSFPEFVIEIFPFVIGKLEGAVDGVIGHETISRIHCKLEFEDGNYYIMDLNSTNGTIVNGNMLSTNERVQLSIGDEIRLGQAVYIFA